MQAAITFSDDSLNPAVRGFLHSPENPNGDALILAHGAGSNCHAPLLVAISETFAGHGYVVLRCDLPFRQERRTGPPFPGNAERDRAGLRNAVAVLRKNVTGSIFLGARTRDTAAVIDNEADNPIRTAVFNGLGILAPNAKHRLIAGVTIATKRSANTTRAIGTAATTWTRRRNVRKISRRSSGLGCPPPAGIGTAASMEGCVI